MAYKLIFEQQARSKEGEKIIGLDNEEFRQNYMQRYNEAQGKERSELEGPKIAFR